MIVPQNGKVVIIDDQINEALPLISLLCKRNIPSLYYDGKINNFPDEPCNGIRIVFLDLHFWAQNDAKTVVSNAIGMLRKIISHTNGPYILFIWSAHEQDYANELADKLKDEKLRPEFVMSLTKSDYFEIKTDLNQEVIDAIHNILLKYNLNSHDADNIQSDIGEILYERYDSFDKIVKPNVLDLIADKLKVEIKKSNLLQVFVLWENTIHGATYTTVNEIYNQIPEGVPQEERLTAMMFFLAHNVLEQQIKTADDQVKFTAAMEMLNDLFYYFYDEDVRKLSLAQVDDSQIEHVPNFEDKLTQSKLNRWLVTSAPVHRTYPGNIFIDDNKQFRLHGAAKTSSISDIEEIELKLQANDSVEYVLVEISGECDIAQAKYYVSKVVPGILIPSKLFEDMKANKVIGRGSMPQYICCWGPIEYNDEDYNILFNLNLATYLPPGYYDHHEPILALRQTYIYSLRTTLANYISRQGVNLFSKK